MVHPHHVFSEQLNHWGREGVPFFFMVDFELNNTIALPLDSISPTEALFAFPGMTNAGEGDVVQVGDIDIQPKPIPFREYREKFDTVYQALQQGHTYLANLTIRTEVGLNTGLLDLFYRSTAPYKLWWKGQFLVFSPETFVRIGGGRIRTFPMKGTVDADLPNAAALVLDNPKEMAEHVTIVDLLRNDLSLVANRVKVVRFRYLDEIVTNRKRLLQVSSEIEGELPEGYQSHLGDILLALLPAGSVCGAPKARTLEVIQQAEQGKRGYYSGVMGIFDGTTLDSAVMIRYIEQEGGRFYYRSGGGITAQSDGREEYQEMIDKIYVPVH